jgi:hypothetical protein
MDPPAKGHSLSESDREVVRAVLLRMHPGHPLCRLCRGRQDFDGHRGLFCPQRRCVHCNKRYSSVVDKTTQRKHGPPNHCRALLFLFSPAPFGKKSAVYGKSLEKHPSDLACFGNFTRCTRRKKKRSFLMATSSGVLAARASSSGPPAPGPKPAPASRLPPRRRPASLLSTNSHSPNNDEGSGAAAADFVETWKVCVCGVGGSGKSCFVNRWALLCGFPRFSSPLFDSGQVKNCLVSRCLALTYGFA